MTIRRLASLFSLVSSVALLATGCAGGDADSTAVAGDQSLTETPEWAKGIKTVWLVVLENHSWSSIEGNPSARYINSLRADGAHARAYSTPPSNHPSETNYIWLESGDNLGIHNDKDPSVNHQGTRDHLVSQLESAGISWRSYTEGTFGHDCPLTGHDSYAPRHVPVLYFDDVTEGNSRQSTRCIQHVRPYGELENDLNSGNVARYNFITPNLCHDMHGSMQMCGSEHYADLVDAGDTWLSHEIPKITGSQAFRDGGAIFITWDEGDEQPHEDASDGPIGMIVLSPHAKPGYANDVPYDHSSTLRTIETIFGVPFLRGARDAADLGDLFQP